MLTRGQDVVLVIDVQGARQVRRAVSDTVGVFVLPPSFEVLEQRLRGRSKDTRRGDAAPPADGARTRSRRSPNTTTSSSTTSSTPASIGCAASCSPNGQDSRSVRPLAERIVDTFQ